MNVVMSIFFFVVIFFQHLFKFNMLWQVRQQGNNNKVIALFWWRKIKHHCILNFLKFSNFLHNFVNIYQLELPKEFVVQGHLSFTLMNFNFHLCLTISSSGKHLEIIYTKVNECRIVMNLSFRVTLAADLKINWVHPSVTKIHLCEIGEDQRWVHQVMSAGYRLPYNHKINILLSFPTMK